MLKTVLLTNEEEQQLLLIRVEEKLLLTRVEEKLLLMRLESDSCWLFVSGPVMDFPFVPTPPLKKPLQFSSTRGLCRRPRQMPPVFLVFGEGSWYI